MNCEALQLDLSLYPDGTLSPDRKAAVDSHLGACPLCRQKLDDIRGLRAALGEFQSSAAPAGLATSVKIAVRTELLRTRNTRTGFISEQLLDYLQMRVMPYAVGTAASVILGVSFLWILLIGNAGLTSDLAADRNRGTTLIYPTTSTSAGDSITPSGLAAERLAVSGESPSINPQGALVELTKALASSHTRDDEVVVIADVFGDGIASVEEVVAPLDDAKTVFELEKALRQDATDAPFVPAFLDKRADSVRVVLKIQRVDVKTNSKKRRRN